MGTAVTTTTSEENEMPELTSSDTLWVCVTHDGTTVSVGLSETSAAAARSADPCYTSSNFDNAGGLIGFMPGAAGDTVSIDDLTIKADRDDDTPPKDYEVTEHKDVFTLDGSGQYDCDPEYDDAGNLLFDGIYEYTFDAWNRLVKTAKAWVGRPFAVSQRGLSGTKPRPTSRQSTSTHSEANIHLQHSQTWLSERR